MSKRMRLAGWTLIGAAVLMLGGCGSSKKPEIKALTNGECMGIADTLKTLRKGDPLPRVVQVMGQPARSYRVVAPFGRTYDVVEYNIGGTACARLVLNSPKKMELLFDEKGGFIGAGRGAYRRLQAATLVRVQGLPVDLEQFETPQ